VEWELDGTWHPDRNEYIIINLTNSLQNNQKNISTFTSTDIEREKLFDNDKP
jgi:hypothetical protein